MGRRLPTVINASIAKKIGDKLKADWNSYTPNQLAEGMKVELEHKDVTGGDLVKTAKIALAHLKETPDYYKLLKRHVEKTMNTSQKRIKQVVVSLVVAKLEKSGTYKPAPGKLIVKPLPVKEQNAYAQIINSLNLVNRGDDSPSNSKMRHGLILAYTPYVDSDGKIRKTNYKAGDTIIFRSYSGDAFVSEEGETLLLMDEYSVLAVKSPDTD